MSVTHQLGIVIPKHCQRCHHAPIVGLPCLSSHVKHKNLEKAPQTEDKTFQIKTYNKEKLVNPSTELTNEKFQKL